MESWEMETVPDSLEDIVSRPKPFTEIVADFLRKNGQPGAPAAPGVDASERPESDFMNVK